MVKYYCDRCKKECTNDYNHLATIKVPDVYTTLGHITINCYKELLLCDACANKYMEFLRGER